MFKIFLSIHTFYTSAFFLTALVRLHSKNLKYFLISLKCWSLFFAILRLKYYYDIRYNSRPKNGKKKLSMINPKYCKQRLFKLIFALSLIYNTQSPPSMFEHFFKANIYQFATTELRRNYMWIIKRLLQSTLTRTAIRKIRVKGITRYQSNVILKEHINTNAKATKPQTWSSKFKWHR